MPSSRDNYEAEVRALAGLRDDLLSVGASAEQIARRLVDLRNALKLRFRHGEDEMRLRIIEARNVARYGNALGPDADELFRRYGTWEAVADAACRPGGGDLRM